MEREGRRGKGEGEEREEEREGRRGKGEGEEREEEREGRRGKGEGEEREEEREGRRGKGEGEEREEEREGRRRRRRERGEEREEEGENIESAKCVRKDRTKGRVGEGHPQPTSMLHNSPVLLDQVEVHPNLLLTHAHHTVSAMVRGLLFRCVLRYGRGLVVVAGGWEEYSPHGVLRGSNTRLDIGQR